MKTLSLLFSQVLSFLAYPLNMLYVLETYTFVSSSFFAAHLFLYPFFDVDDMRRTNFVFTFIHNFYKIYFSQIDAGLSFYSLDY